MPTWAEILLNILDIKNVVTLLLTVIFDYLLIKGNLAPEFMTVYSMVITFYFTNRDSVPMGTTIANAVGRVRSDNGLTK